MTTVTFRMEGDRITGFDSQGHSGYAESGSDIVCDPTAESTCQALMTGLMVYFAQLHDEYPDNIEVLEDD